MSKSFISYFNLCPNLFINRVNNSNIVFIENELYPCIVLNSEDIVMYEIDKNPALWRLRWERDRRDTEEKLEESKLIICKSFPNV